jgi:hypothetical protein
MIIISDKKQNLQDFIIQKSKELNCDELCILSGYIGLGPIDKISNLKDLKLNIVFGLAIEVMTQELKDLLSDYHLEKENNISIYGSNIKSHAKIYLWKNRGKVIYSLCGSANFSSNGLLSINREVLSEVKNNSLKDLNNYYLKVFKSSISIVDVNINKTKKLYIKTPIMDNDDLVFEEFETSSLFSPKYNINWGHSIAKNNLRDSCIPITVGQIKNHPEIFQPKTNNNGLGKADNDPIDIIWDDGTNMVGLFEGTQIINELRYPNKISTYKDKKILGDYIRERMKLEKGVFVTKENFDEYGRNSITIKKIGEGQFYFDFSNNK